MSTLYHLECRFGLRRTEASPPVLSQWKDMKKEGCSCWREIETMLYITTSGDLSALQLTSPPPPSLCLSTCLSGSPAVSYSHFDFALGLFTLFCSTVTFLITRSYPCSCLSGCTCICICVCTALCLIEFVAFSSSPALLVCFGCQVVPVWYLRYVLARVSVCAYNSLPLFVCLLYLSVSFICLLARCCPSRKQPSWPFLLLQLKSHTLVRLPSSNTKLCPAECQIISASVPFFSLSLSLLVFVSIGLSFSPCLSLAISYFCVHLFSPPAHTLALFNAFSLSPLLSSQWLSSFVALVHRCVQKCFCEAKAEPRLSRLEKLQLIKSGVSTVDFGHIKGATGHRETFFAYGRWWWRRRTRGGRGKGGRQ